MSKINLDMTGVDAIIAMSENNPGAATVLSRVVREAANIDPQAVGNGWFVIMTLNDMGIYGPRIWMLYKDVCNQSLPHMLAVLRADQLGQLAGVTSDRIQHAIDNHGEGIDIDAAMGAVQARLPQFNQEETP